MENFKVNYNGKEINFCEIGKMRDDKRNPIKYCFIRKTSHILTAGPRYSVEMDGNGSSELQKAVEERIKNGWKQEEIIIEGANMPYLHKWFGKKNGT